MPKIFVGQSFSVALISGIENLDWTGRWKYQDFPWKYFCLTVPKSHVGESFIVALISGSEKVYGQQGGGEYRDFQLKFFVSQSQTFRRGILYCCSNVGYRECLDKNGEYQGFPSESFCPTVPKRFVGESFTVALFSGTGKLWIRGGGGVSRFSVQNFSSHSAEVFRTGILCCINFGYRKSLDKGGGVSRFSVENFSSHSAENFRGGILYCCINFGIRKGLDKKGGSFTVFRRTFFVSQCRKFS